MHWLAGLNLAKWNTKRNVDHRSGFCALKEKDLTAAEQERRQLRSLDTAGTLRLAADRLDSALWFGILDGDLLHESMVLLSYQLGFVKGPAYNETDVLKLPKKNSNKKKKVHKLNTKAKVREISLHTSAHLPTFPTSPSPPTHRPTNPLLNSHVHSPPTPLSINIHHTPPILPPNTPNAKGEAGHAPTDGQVAL